MNAVIFVKDGKKFVSVNLPSPIDSLAYQSFVEQNDVAANLLAELWPEVANKYGEIDRIEISDYEVTRNVKGDSVAFGATATITNLNMVAMLAKIAARTEAKRQLAIAFADVKAMLKQAVTVEIHGYEAGKRGRKSHAVSRESVLEAARKALAS